MWVRIPPCSFDCINTWNMSNPQLVSFLQVHYENSLDEQIREEFLTWENWCIVLDNIRESRQLDEGLRGILTKAGAAVSASLARIFGPLLNDLKKVVETVKEFLSLGDILNALKERSMFAFFRAIGFKFVLMFRALAEFGKAWRQGLGRIFEELTKNRVFDKIRAGVMKVDEVLDRYPLLKKIGGLVVAGILIYIWLNMTFIGDLEYDMNLASVGAALLGKFTLVDLFVSPAGVMMLTLFATGGIISAPWLGASTLNMAVAITYTAIAKAREHGPAVLSRIKSMISTQ